jgi:hypothetical protein
MLAVVFFLAFRATASLKLEAPRNPIDKLLIADVLDAEIMGDSVLGAETENLKVVRRSQSVKPETAELDHFAKAGGTFVGAVAQRSIKTNLSIIRELRGNSGSKADTFSIGMVRNPFSYLVSIWTYGSSKKGANRNQVEEMYSNKSHPGWPAARDMMNSWSQDIGNGLLAGTTAEDKRRFAEWVHAVSPKDRLGYVSGRFYCKYLNHGKLFDIKGKQSCNNQVGPLNLHELGLEKKQERSILTSLDTFTLQDTTIDCWIFTENLDESMKNCFKKFEEIAGPGSVNWRQYELAAAQPAKNPSPHVQCKELYDDKLAAYVSRSESGMLRAFGYERC